MRPMFAADYVKRLGLSEGKLRRVQRALDYLAEKGYLHMVHAGKDQQRIVIGITAEGIDEMERSEDHAAQRSGGGFNSTHLLGTSKSATTAQRI